MRIAVTSDLHYGMNKKCDAGAVRFIRDLKRQATIDVLVICGDVAENVNLAYHQIGDNHRRLFSVIKSESAAENIAFCAGSHDIWTSGRYNSWLIYTQNLRTIARECGATYLDDENLYIDKVAVVGAMGHYDYSFSTKNLTINGEKVEERHYRSKIPPGYASPVWNDARYVRWPLTDKEACRKICHRFEARYREALERSEHIIVATHTVPIMEMNGHQHKKDARSNFLNAFSGTKRLGDILFRNLLPGKSVRAFSGHTHLAAGPLIKEGIEFQNVGGDYGMPRFISIEI